MALQQTREIEWWLDRRVAAKYRYKKRNIFIKYISSGWKVASFVCLLFLMLDHSIRQRKNEINYAPSICLIMSQVNKKHSIIKMKFHVATCWFFSFWLYELALVETIVGTKFLLFVETKSTKSFTKTLFRPFFLLSKKEAQSTSFWGAYRLLFLWWTTSCFRVSLVSPTC